MAFGIFVPLTVIFGTVMYLLMNHENDSDHGDTTIEEQAKFE